jgi:hypothetical protein
VRVGATLSGGSAGVSGCAGEVGDVIGESGGGGWPTGEPAGKSEDAGSEGDSRPTVDSAGESCAASAMAWRQIYQWSLVGLKNMQ